MTMSRLDVLVPHYRDPDGLTISLDSIAAQTWTGDLRIVVVDDGSEANTVNAVRTILDRYDLPITFLRNERNCGRPYTRNRLLDAVDSDFVAWLDAGDVWYPDKLAHQFDRISELRYRGEDIDRYWITCNYDWQWIGRAVRKVVQDTDVRQFRELMLGQKLRAYLWTLLGTARAFKIAGRFDERLPRLQDLDYFAHFMLAGGVLVNTATSDPLCRYFKSDLGRNAQEIRNCNRLIYQKYQPHLQAFGPSFLKTIRYNAEMLSARYSENNGARMLTSWYSTRAFVAHPRRYIGGMRYRMNNA